jgi:hypothetical protein
VVCWRVATNTETWIIETASTLAGVSRETVSLEAVQLEGGRLWVKQNCDMLRGEIRTIQLSDETWAEV